MRCETDEEWMLDGMGERLYIRCGRLISDSLVALGYAGAVTLCNGKASDYRARRCNELHVRSRRYLRRALWSCNCGGAETRNEIWHGFDIGLIENRIQSGE